LLKSLKKQAQQLKLNSILIKKKREHLLSFLYCILKTEIK